MVAIATSALSLHQGIGIMEMRNKDTPLSLLPKFKRATITADETADNANTITIDIWEKFGMQKFLGIKGFIHTTKDSVIVEEAPTTAVTSTDSSTSLEITVGGATGNKQRCYIIYGA